MTPSPDDIEKKRFLVALRGYDRDEVDAFLRGVAADQRQLMRALEVAESRPAPAPSEQALFEALGAEDVATFRTSGNVVFEAPRDMARALEKHLEQALGHEVVIFLRTASEVKQIAAHEPFPPDEVEASNGKLQVALLEKKPAAATQKKVLALATDQDLLAFGKRELYWLPSGGTLESQLDRTALDKLIGPATMRTKGTIELLAAKFFG
jgi:DivIVA domain-containing protein